jgi:Fe-S-cluster containining protein
MTELDKIRAREYDPAMEAHAQAVAAQISAKVDRARIHFFGTAAAHFPGPARKVALLRSMAGELANAARQLVPCSRGCAKCCHMATALSEDEAAVIAAATGAPLATPTDYLHGEAAVERFNGQPCPFLQEGLCGIYAERPLSCRMHLHLDRDSTLCQIVPGATIRVPRLDTIELDRHYMQAFDPDPRQVRLADIREFFPQGLGT